MDTQNTIDSVWKTCVHIDSKLQKHKNLRLAYEIAKGWRVEANTTSYNTAIDLTDWAPTITEAVFLFKKQLTAEINLRIDGVKMEKEQLDEMKEDYESMLQELA